jgi:uncharacterized protein
MSKKYLARPLRLVFDTNVYIASLLSPDGYTIKYVYESGLRLRYTLGISIAIFAEIENKIRSIKPELLESSQLLFDFLRSNSDLVGTTLKISVLDDEPDNRILECAVAYGADLIVSFDKDLLRLKEFQGIAIIHPAQLQDYFGR